MKKYLGIELGSTRIKAVLVDEDHRPLASGSHEWQNSLIDGVWTYPMDEVWAGIQACYADLKREYREKHGEGVGTVSALGISAMMHGYLPFDEKWELLTPFRTWRNTMTEEAAAELSDKFGFNIPQRWSIAHLYQAMKNNEPHVEKIAYFTTLAGYIHFKLTGKNVLGIGEASGMFPIDSDANDYDSGMLKQFDELAAQYPLKKEIRSLLPGVLVAGDDAGQLTEEGAKLIDPDGELEAGMRLCPPEGDAGTGMVATNSIAVKTGNISAGTSVFAMIVLEKQLSRMYLEIDMVTTPAGNPVAMVHCNNFTSDIDAWMRIFKEVLQSFGVEKDKDDFYATLYKKSVEQDASSEGMVSYNYFAGEPITQTEEGRPLFARMPGSRFSLADFMRTILFASMGTLRMGMDILTEKEKVELSAITGHGGFFKTKGVGQNLMAAALKTPVTVMESAGEGGPWGMAILAAYMMNKSDGEGLEAYLNNQVFRDAKSETVAPDKKDMIEYDAFMQLYHAGIAVEKAAITNMK